MSNIESTFGSRSDHATLNLGETLKHSIFAREVLEFVCREFDGVTAWFVREGEKKWTMSIIFYPGMRTEAEAESEDALAEAYWMLYYSRVKERVGYYSHWKRYLWSRRKRRQCLERKKRWDAWRAARIEHFSAE